jgi:hypothetical protein
MDLKKFAFLGFGKPKEQFPIRSFNDFPVPIPREVMNQWEREAKSRNLDDYAKANNFFAEKFNPWLETPAGKAWNKKQADVFNRQKGKTAMDLKKFAQEKIASSLKSIGSGISMGVLERAIKHAKGTLPRSKNAPATIKQIKRLVTKMESRSAKDPKWAASNRGSLVKSITEKANKRIAAEGPISLKKAKKLEAFALRVKKPFPKALG